MVSLSLKRNKLERIVRVEATAEGFELPEDFDASAFLAGAWGIMGGDAAVEVALRFTPAVAGRVKE